MDVDLLFQNLVDLHGVDADALRAELKGAVRTPDYPGQGNARRVLASLPPGFPRFRATAGADRLVLERMRFPGDVVYSATSGTATLSIARPPQLPLSILTGLADRPLTDLVGGEGFDERMRILSASTSVRREAGREMDTLELTLHMPTTRLKGDGGRGASRPDAVLPEPSEMLDPHLRRYADDLAEEIVASIDPADPRRWRDDLTYRGAIVGMRVETRRGADHLILRFPYDKRVARSIGQGRFGAWYDRDTWSWCIAAGDLDADAMLQALAEYAPVFILDQEGAVYGGAR